MIVTKHDKLTVLLPRCESPIEEEMVVMALSHLPRHFAADVTGDHKKIYEAVKDMRDGAGVIGVQVTPTKTFRTYFLGVVGVTSFNASATATATGSFGT